MKCLVILCLVTSVLSQIDTACMTQRAKALKGGLIGATVPQCDSEGNFKAMQCSGSTGYCWCVDTTTGDKMVGSAARGSVDCSTTTKTSACTGQRATAMKGGIGAFIPACDTEGNFKAKQCWGSTGYCWCVNPANGVKLVGTEARGAVDCSQTACQKQAATAAANLKKGMVGVMVPKCDSNGDYTPEQCSGSTGMCWCVDVKTGEEVIGSSVRGTPECGAKKMTACQTKRAAVEKKGLMGAVVPSCDNTTGLYTPVQCSGSTGFCWCVDVTSGVKILGSALRGTPDCSKQTPCQAAHARAEAQMKKGMVGGFMPTCNVDGSYTKKQCHASTGYCWCVDTESGKKIVGSDVRGTPKC